MGIKVDGILAPGTYNGTAVNLLPYFDGGFASSNRGGASGVAVNFLDDGGAAPLMMNMPSNGTSSNQYMLLTHLYEYFGVLLGCSMQGNSDYPAYDGEGSQYQVHKFMDLSAAEVGYFITQVAMSAASFGVAESDLAIVGKALTSTFDVKCAAPAIVVPAQGAMLQSICIGDACPMAANATCAMYGNATKPAIANSTLVGNSSSSSSRASGSSTASAPAATVSTAGAAAVGLSAAAVVGGLFAVML